MARIRLGTLLGVLLVALALGPAMAGDGVTVGQFLKEIALTKQLTFTEDQGAVSALRANGYDIPSLPLNAALNEGHVVSIARSLGLQINSTSPETPFTRENVDTFFGTFGQELGSSFGSGDDSSVETNKANPLLKGKGKKKGLRKRSPQDPI